MKKGNPAFPRFAVAMEHSSDQKRKYARIVEPVNQLASRIQNGELSWTGSLYLIEARMAGEFSQNTGVLFPLEGASATMSRAKKVSKSPFIVPK